jgi:prepilin-type N-terminal cleavage/methylation domain-containing protein
MLIQSSRRRQGFTLVEIMIVVAIIALLASIAVPSFMRARKRSQATATLNSLRVLDNAKDQYAMEFSKGGNVTPNGTDLAPYVKSGSKLYTQLMANAPLDALNAPITVNNVDTPPSVNATTKSSFTDVLGGSTGADAFFGAYK